jgi:hypothetical protein
MAENRHPFEKMCLNILYAPFQDSNSHRIVTGAAQCNLKIFSSNPFLGAYG